MSTIFGIIQKITLNSQFPVEAWLNKTNLLTTESLPVSDVQLIKYLEDLQAVVEYASDVSNRVPTSYFYQSLDSTELFLVVSFSTREQWNSVNNSQVMQKYQESKNVVYDALGWIDHGYKVIDIVSIQGAFIQKSQPIVGAIESWIGNQNSRSEEVAGVTGANIIWNYF